MLASGNSEKGEEAAQREEQQEVVHIVVRLQASAHDTMSGLGA